MAEQTPSNLTQAASWMVGGARAAVGSNNVDRAIDNLESRINKFADALERFTGQFSKARASVGGLGGGGATQQSSSASGVGGNYSFSGAAPASSYQQTQSGMWVPPGSVPPQQPQQPPTNGGGWSFGKAAGAGAVAALGVYTSGHFSQQQVEATMAMRGAPGGNWQPQARAGLYNNGSAASDSDAYGMYAFQSRNSGFGMGTAGWNQQKSMITGATAADPTLTQTQVAQAQHSLGKASSFNAMRRMGVNPLNSQGHADPRSVARQILAKMGSSRVRTIEQVNAAFGPSGSATVTLEAWVSAGMLDASTAEVVRSEMFNILMTQVQGMSFSSYDSNMRKAGGTGRAAEQARERLGNAGLQADTPVGWERVSAGKKRDSNEGTISSFVTGLEHSTNSLNAFRDALNKILENPLVGGLTGYSSGWLGSSPIGSLLSSAKGLIPGGGQMGALMGAGGSAPTMSRAGWGGEATPRQSDGGNSKPKGTKGMGSGLSLIAPRPGIDAMSSEQDYGTRTIGQGWHTGVDLSGGTGDPIKAAAGGVVSAAGWGASGDSGYGNVVVIDHGGGWKTMYAHMASISKGKGKEVRAGEIIGGVGDTGSYSRGSHLHFEVWKNGKDVDPEPYLRGAKMTGASGKGSTKGVKGSGSTGQDLGQTGSYANASVGGGGGGGYAWGEYSEVAALGLSGGGGGFAGGVPGEDPYGESGEGSVGSGSGGPGDLRIGAYNVWRGTSKKETIEDFEKITSMVDVFGTSEARSKHKQFAPWLRKQGWGYMQGEDSDTGIAYDKGKYRVVSRGNQRIEGTIWNGKKMTNSVPYMLLQDKQSGAKFWVMSAHTQVGGHRGGKQGAVMQKQYAQINALYKRLEGSGNPVFLVGDLNNPMGKQGGALADGVAPKGTKATGRNLDYLIWRPGDAKLSDSGALSGIGFDHRGSGQVNSDHPFVWGEFSLPGQGGGGSLPSGGNPSKNQALGKAMAANYGWTGKQWDALRELWMRESGWNHTADNPSSSAYGIPQALIAMHKMPKGYVGRTTGSGAGTQGYGGDPRVQIKWGLDYIKGRYGSPAGAMSFWNRNNWYAGGAWDLQEDHDARVHKGEMIVPSKIADVIRDELTSPGIRDNLGRSTGGGGGMQITFESGAIQVVFPHANMSKREAEKAGEWIVDAMMEDQRMKALAEG